MFNVRIKQIFNYILISISAFSCIDQAAENEKKAYELFLQAVENFETASYETASIILDSIDSIYPQAFETRKEVSKLRPQIMERWTAKKLSGTDSLLVENQILGNELRDKLSYVKNPLEGYYVATSMGNINVRQTPGLHGRISPSFKFYLTSSCPVKIGSTSIRLESNNESISSAIIPFDGERNNRSGKCETITFTEAESAPLAEFITNHADRDIQIVFVSENLKEHKINMTEENKLALITGFKYAQSVIRDKQLQIEKARLERQLELSRKQIARTQSTNIKD